MTTTESESEAARWSTHIRPIGFLVAVLLLAIVAASVFLGSETSRRFNDMKTSWIGYADEAGRKSVWISDIRGHFGYGGMIHNFKNYVLRQDPAYRSTMKRDFANLYRTIDAYASSNPTERERVALFAIRDVARVYERQIDRIDSGISRQLDAEAIDAHVRVDDTEALAALKELELIWQEQNASHVSRVVGAISEGEQLTGWVILVVTGMAALVLIIFGLLHQLVRHSLDATHQLFRELFERKRAQDAEKKLARAVEQSPSTIIITDVNGRIEFVNRKFAELTGFGPQEAIGKRPNLLKSGHTTNEAYRQMWEMLKAGREWRGIFKNRKRDGSHYWASTAILPLLDDEGAITNFIGIGEDITEKKMVKEQIARAQKMEAVGVLAGGVAHDFNNVLMAITGNVQLARMGVEDGDSPAEIDESLGHIDLAARRAQGLVRQLLAFARRQPTRSRPIDLHDHLEATIKLLRAAIPTNIALSVAGSAPGLVVEADPTVMDQIIMNLCRNAAEAFGGKAGNIRLSLSVAEAGSKEASELLPSCEGNVVRLIVADDGPGMPEPVRQRVFDPFYSTKPIGKGTGLGLAVVKNAMDDLGGAIALETEPGEGTRFTLAFPLIHGEVPERMAPAELPRGHEAILLVDDEEDVLFTLRRMLTRLGYRIDAYSDPLLARQAFEADPGRFDILVTDMMMPNMNGTELIEVLRQIRPDLPVLLCSAYHTEQGDMESERIWRVEKPVDMAGLSEVLRQMITSGNTR
ncbi:hybrid sensor histidine kinase/response regulator [Coralliovum pocilloporae]|uniref:hybrid sensor histidine kinase/response regulator n=1 Tax=Coralliovum pocilloporae TaxID=3066369 RepID=UPI003306EFD6